MKYVRQKVSFEFVIFQLHEVLSMRVEASHRRFFRFNCKRGYLVTLRHGDPADAGNTAPQFLLAAKCNKVSPSMLMIKILSMNLVLGKSGSTHLGENLGEKFFTKCARLLVKSKDSW